LTLTRAPSVPRIAPIIVTIFAVPLDVEPGRDDEVGAIDTVGIDVSPPFETEMGIGAMDELAGPPILTLLV
jgi:hypothetical protein